LLAKRPRVDLNRASVTQLSRLLIALSLFGDAVLFFRKPLFSERSMFPWDFPGVQLPLVQFLADQLKRGELALWDPYTYCGNPIFANIQASLFHPLILAAALLSDLFTGSHLALLVEWAVVIQVAAAGLGAYALMRAIGVSRASAWATAVMCQTGPYFASRAEHIGAVMAVSWMPVAWLLVVRMAAKPTARGLALLSTALCLAVLGGFPAATLAVFASTVLLSMLLAATGLATYRLPLLTLIGCALGVGMSALQFVPTTQLTENSVAKYRLEWLGTGGGLKWQSLVSLVDPNHYHIFDLQNFNGPWDPSFLYLYSSILGLVFALAAIVAIRNPWVNSFLVLMILGAFWMMGDSTPLFRLIYPLVPERIRIGVHPEYTYCIFANCLAVLAGLGIDRFVSDARLRLAIAAIIALDLYFVGSDRPMNCGPGGDASGISTNAVDGHPELLSRVRELSAASFPAARIDTIGTSINWSQSAPTTRVPTANGCSPFALERLIQVRLGLGQKDGRRSGWYYPVVDPGSPAVCLMADRYLLAAGASVSSVKSAPNFTAVGEVAGVSVFLNRTALPRAFLVQSVLATDYEGALAFIRAPKPDYLSRAAVEGPVSLEPSAVGRSSGTALVTSYDASRMSILVDTPSPAYLVVIEAWYPGWEASLDGADARIYATDVAFRGLAVPAGRHHVEMMFRPKILYYSTAISLFFGALRCDSLVSRS
jgi:hypothetical protein